MEAQQEEQEQDDDRGDEGAGAGAKKEKAYKRTACCVVLPFHLVSTDIDSCLLQCWKDLWYITTVGTHVLR